MMGVPKQKWTSEEEAALRAGVEKYGPGKWRAIQRDPNFGPCLVSRSNVDLKDKWRNMNVGASGHGHSRAKRIKKVTEEEVSVKPLAIMPAEDAIDTAAVVQAVSGNRTERRSLGSGFVELVLKPLKEPNGFSLSEIAGIIEGRKIIKVNNCEFLVEDRPLKGPKFGRKDSEGTSTPTFLRDMPRRMRGDVGSKKPDMDFELARSKIRTADKAAMAEVEAATAAAEETAMEADVGEEAAELARSKIRIAGEAAIAKAEAIAEAEAAITAAEEAAMEADAAEEAAELAKAAAYAVYSEVRQYKKSKRESSF
ncbi:hypothetical protein O6H91_08G053100 [Diphasiastrum complanatum]|uniref:Uncharacterized protein n=1 Tax=Diphasiastrum complanatum TaxID=34168 RepID=A0ACC2CXN8_DIPCM|nr:hypothetical protein O6H91_08G053100 [Diphasiastrum complanatum]